LIGSQDLPREKLYKKGAEALTDLELLQVIIGSGCKGHDYKEIAKNLNNQIQKLGAENISIEAIKEVKGIGDAKATVIFAALELWRRKLTKQTAPLIDSPEKAVAQLWEIAGKKQEHFALLTLDGARRLINNRIVTIGTLNASLVHAREVFSYAIEDRAASIIIAHNHPSGMLEISEQDIKVTKNIQSAGELLGIYLDDHLIVTVNGFISVMN